MENKIPNSDIIGYEGAVGQEKAIHHTHFWVSKKWKGKHPKDDPDWEYVGVGRWRRISKKRVMRRKGAEVQNG